jgi:hypothetical protein
VRREDRGDAMKEFSAACCIAALVVTVLYFTVITVV